MFRRAVDGRRDRVAIRRATGVDVPAFHLVFISNSYQKSFDDDVFIDGTKCQGETNGKQRSVEERRQFADVLACTRIRPT